MAKIELVKIPPTQHMADGGYWERDDEYGEERWVYRSTLMPKGYIVSIHYRRFEQDWDVKVALNRIIEIDSPDFDKDFVLSSITSSRIIDNRTYYVKEDAMRIAELIVNQLTSAKKEVKHES